MIVTYWFFIVIPRPTNYSNDNIALLEAGFNKEIEKNTSALMKHEKELDVYQAMKVLIDKDSMNELQPAVEAANPAYKMFLQFKAENVSGIVSPFVIIQTKVTLIRVPKL